MGYELRGAENKGWGVKAAENQNMQTLLRDKLVTKINDQQSLSTLLNGLDQETATLVINTLKDKLPKIIENGEQLNSLFNKKNKLSLESKGLVCDALKMSAFNHSNYFKQAWNEFSFSFSFLHIPTKREQIIAAIEKENAYAHS